MGYNWCSASVLSATLCFHSALSAILWFQPHAAAPNATLKTNGFFDARGQFMVPEAVKLWVQSHSPLFGIFFGNLRVEVRGQGPIMPLSLRRGRR
jgi:hypothetical protein